MDISNLFKEDTDPKIISYFTSALPHICIQMVELGDVETLSIFITKYNLPTDSLMRHLPGDPSIDLIKLLLGNTTKDYYFYFDFIELVGKKDNRIENYPELIHKVIKRQRRADKHQYLYPISKNDTLEQLQEKYNIMRSFTNVVLVVCIEKDLYLSRYS